MRDLLEVKKRGVYQLIHTFFPTQKIHRMLIWRKKNTQPYLNHGGGEIALHFQDLLSLKITTLLLDVVSDF